MVDLRRLDICDVILVGGTLSACYLASVLGAEGLRVAVTCPGASLAPEITATLRAWINRETLKRAPKPMRSLITECLKKNSSPLLHLGIFSEALEDLLFESGVAFYYRAAPGGVAVDSDGIRGVLLGGKFGLGLIEAPVVVDCTPHATIATSAGADIRPRIGSEDEISVFQVIQYLGEDVAAEPSSIAGLNVSVHGSLLNYELRTKLDLADPFFESQTAVRVRENLTQMEVGVDAVALRAADRPAFEALWRLKGSGGAEALDCIRVSEQDGLFVLGATGDFDAAVAGELASDPVTSLQLTADLTSLLHRETKARKGRTSVGPLSLLCVSPRRDSPVKQAGAISIRDPSFCEPDTDLLNVEFQDLPLLASFQTTVCGGGTAGATAAAESARGGTSTVCVEANGDLGGVHTVGGVPHYWYGRWSRYMARQHVSLKRRTEAKNLPWSLAQLALVREAGAEVLLLTPLCGVVHNHRTVQGVIALTPHGLGVIGTDLVIDATGDADMAAWAGAPYTYGSERDEITMWCSFGKFRHDRKQASRLYFSVADQRSLQDTTRAIVAARRQIGVFGEAEYPQFNIVTRESRHIVGRRRVTYADMISDRRHRDSVLVFKSNVDIKGIASSDPAMSGFVERDFNRNWRAHIPYGALLPDGLDNVLVTGKAYSASHDALAMARMQADVSDMGAVAGYAAAAASQSASFRDVNISDLQSDLVEAGLMEPWDLGVPESRWPDSVVLESLADRAVTGPLELDDQLTVLKGSDVAVRSLRQALLESADSRRALVIARMLACLRDRGGSDLLLAELDRVLEADDLPKLWVERHRHDMPDHGWSPEPVYLINALALAEESEVVPRLGRLVDKLKIDKNLNDHRFAYIHAVSYALERLALPEGIPVLKTLLTQPGLRGRVLDRGADPRDSSDHVSERCAYLELCLGRALARCGDAEGYLRLISYLEDQRLFLARSALLELQDLTGERLGFDVDKWKGWLEVERRSLPTKPYDQTLT